MFSSLSKLSFFKKFIKAKAVTKRIKEKVLKELCDVIENIEGTDEG